MGKEVQRALLWVILLGSLFMLWDNYQVYKGGESFFGPAAVQAPAEEAASADAIPTTQNAAKEQSLPQVASAPSEPVVVTTDRMKVTFDLNGARVVGSEMLLFPQQASWTDVGLAGKILGNEPAADLGNVHLFELNKNRTYMAQSGLVGGDYPTHLDQFKLVSSKLDMGSDEKLEVAFEATKGGVKVVKTYRFTRGNYGIEVATTVTNEGAAPVKPQIYYQISRDGGKPEGENSMYSTFTGPAVYSEEENFQKIQFSDIASKDASFVESTDNGWIAMIQHHFVSAWIPNQGEARQNYVREVSKDLYAVGTLLPMKEIAPGASETTTAILYSGPQEQQRLEQLAPGLELVVDYSWLTFLAKPIYWLLSFLYGIVGNWGWAIVLLTCIV